jgi:hypothetical protein
MFIQDVHISGQVGIRHMGVSANESFNPVAEHDIMHVRGFHATAIVIKRDCGLWHELMDLFIYSLRLCFKCVSVYQKKRGIQTTTP